MFEKTLGIIGGGQLGSMLAQSAKKLNIKMPNLLKKDLNQLINTLNFQVIELKKKLLKKENK